MVIFLLPASPSSQVAARVDKSFYTGRGPACFSAPPGLLLCWGLLLAPHLPGPQMDAAGGWSPQEAHGPSASCHLCASEALLSPHTRQVPHTVLLASRCPPETGKVFQVPANASGPVWVQRIAWPSFITRLDSEEAQKRLLDLPTCLWPALPHFLSPQDTGADCGGLQLGESCHLSSPQIFGSPAHFLPSPHPTRDQPRGSMPVEVMTAAGEKLHVPS